MGWDAALSGARLAKNPMKRTVGISGKMMMMMVRNVDVCRWFCLAVVYLCASNAGAGGNEDEDLNSDDDDDDDAEVERTTEHVILCRYDKVTRQKQKWKAQVSHAPPFW